MDAKTIFQSRTLWFNVIAFAGVFVQAIANTQFLGVDPKLQAEIITVINFVLRFLTTKPVSL